MIAPTWVGADRDEHLRRDAGSRWHPRGPRGGCARNRRHRHAHADLRAPASPSSILLRLGGGGLLLGIGSIHLDLYVTGYRSIPTIGNLFLLQVVSALGLGLLVLATGRPLVAAGGAGLAFGTLAGYLVSLHQSLFGFREVRTAAGIWAGVLEVVAFATLSALALSPRTSSSAAPSRPRVPRLSRAASRLVGTLAAGVTMLLAVLLGISLATALTAATSGKGRAAATLDVGTIGGAQRIVTNSRGYTLYWFGLDTATTSACSSTCEAYWHPVVGTPVAGPGLTGTLGTIRRSDGSIQATFDDHPLYSYVGDSGPARTTATASRSTAADGTRWRLEPDEGSCAHVSANGARRS